MRSTWIILVFMLLAGVAMYFISKRQPVNGPYDSISLSDTSSLSRANTRVFLAYEPVEINYTDSIGWQQDSTALKKLLDGSNTLNFFNKHYQSAGLYITYNNQYFFDLEINKTDTARAYDISFRIAPRKDSFFIEGKIDTHLDSVVRFSGPMLPLYREFSVIYNHKLPPDPADSLDPGAPKSDKTISISRN
ncbi:MAG TPA: hypothetical protein VFS31_06850 [Chitinophagaceae bacterium]|nr:hypothetical protein [Chitinophagaceae bacterium]